MLFLFESATSILHILQPELVYPMLKTADGAQCETVWTVGSPFPHNGTLLSNEDLVRRFVNTDECVNMHS